MYSQINYIKQDSTKSHPTVSKTNRVSKYTLSVLKLCYSQHKYRDSSKKILSFYYFSHVLEKWINKFETSQILEIRKIVKQVASKQ